MSFGAVVLAAGEGSRIGTPKALLEVRGRTLLEREITRLREAGIDEIVVVLGCRADEARRDPALARGVRTVVNASWQDGQTSSLLAGLEALPEVDAFLIQPLDHAFVTLRIVRALLDAARAGTGAAGPRSIFRPHAPPGAWGHPVLFPASYREEFLALGDLPGNTVARRHRDRVCPVIIDDARSCRDVDTPEDLRDLETFLAPI